MAYEPGIDTPCPVKDRLAEVLDGDFCRKCQERVIDLTPMNDDERRDVLANRTGKICVMYRRPLRPALAAAALAALAMPMAAAAQDAGAEPVAEEMAAGGIEEIIVGGVGARKDNKSAAVEDPADLAMPDLPVIEEGGSSPAS